MIETVRQYVIKRNSATYKLVQKPGMFEYILSSDT